MKKPTRKQRRSSRKDHGWLPEILGLLLFVLAILAAVALVTYPRENLLHDFGDLLASLLMLPFGRWPAFIFPLLFLLWSYVISRHRGKGRATLYSLGALGGAFWLSFFFYLVQAPAFQLTHPELVHEDAGAFGVVFGELISGPAGFLGAWILWLLAVLIPLIIWLGFRPSLWLEKILHGLKAGWLWLRDRQKEKLQRPEIEIANNRAAREGESKTAEAATNLEEVLPEDADAGLVRIPEAGQTLALDSAEAKPVRSSKRRQEGYQLPPLSLLSNPPPESPDAPEELTSKAQRLQAALADFGVGARVVKVNPGPVITRFDLEPDPGVKVSRISALADDLALVLRARAIRIQAPIPGQGAVGVEIPNRHPSTVVLKSVVSHPSFQEHPSPLAIALGQTASGEPYVSDLGRMPHLLVAGTTGSGKSVCLNAIIASLLFRNPPEKLQFVIIDPKKLEMAIWARLARHHLMISPELDEEVITTPENAVLAMGGVELEMGRRYDMLAAAGVRNIEEFNGLAAKGEAVSPGGESLPPLSYLIVVVDELADLMMISAKEIEEPIARLAQMARAVGIHLIVATQRPSVDVITGVIKANFPARLAFQVASKVDSRTILDANGAETLLGNGDALFIPPGRGQPERIHSCFVSQKEIEDIVSHVENQPDDFYRYPLVLPRLEGMSGSPDGEMMGEVDEFFEEAVRIVIHQGQASVSILQRRLKIGYARAGRLIDQLERAGIVGPFDGSKAREVLVDENWLNAHGSGITPKDLE